MDCNLHRKNTKKIRVGELFIGGDAPITVQSMANTDTRNVAATVEQIKRLEEAGCDIIRIAIPDNEAAQAIKDIKKAIYKKANKLKAAAKSSEGYKTAAIEFRKISGYKDADDLALECDRLGNRMEERAVKKRLMNFGIIFLCMIAVFIVALSSNTKYYFAHVCKATGSYYTSIETYKKLGSFRVSEEKLTECEYLYGLKLKQSGDFKGARKAFMAAGAYKDSEEQNVLMEKRIIQNSKIGDTVTIGENKWIILDIQNGQALLLKKTAQPYMAYHSSYDKVTWEASAVRQWLNSEIFMETFTEAERKNILLKEIKNNDNSTYATEAGTDTQDYVFLLSIDEAKKYQELFPKFKSNSWLRSPGSNQYSAAFLSVEGTIMDYGYAVNSEELKLRPALWFNIN